MPPKKAKKISLNEFLGDTTLGSWADEMDSLPSAPSGKTDQEQSRPGDRYARRDDMLPPRSDRMPSVREDIPLPSQPPYTAYVGNLAFDLTEVDLEQFFAGSAIKSVKIIKDREEKPKGFGYVEFDDLDGLKDAIAKTGSSLSGRTVRISVAEPPKERGGFGGGPDDSKFEGPWRRDGPLPDLPSRDSSRRRFDPHLGERPSSGLTEGVDDWRSSRPPRMTEPDTPSFKRKGSGFLPPDAQPGQADKDEVWSIGSKFKPSAPSDEPSSRFGSLRGKAEASPKEVSELDNDWRSSARPRPTGRSNVSPSASTPPTPQLGRKKLELLPRSGAGSVSPSPLSSPKMASTPPVPNPSRANPFGAAKPVDVSQREKEVVEKLERDREVNKERLTMSRTNSRTGSERGGPRARSPPAVSSPVVPPRTLAPNVRPTLSFANVAAKKESSEKKDQVDADINEVTDKTADLTV